jgi:hypothetical protein
LNNLGSMTGVKSITSMSGADLASQGNLNKMGNLAQVKSVESMGRNDSYAFLEVFFGDRSMSTGNLAGKADQKGVKRERDEDNDVGLSLEDEAPPSSTVNKQSTSDVAPTPAPGAPVPAPLPGISSEKDSTGDTGTLKRAYDDALAARGLISVSRSCEKLTDLVLPAKMRKTLSQEFLRHHQAQAQAMQQSQQQQSQYGQYSFSAPPQTEPSDSQAPAASSQQYPGQYPGQHPDSQDQGAPNLPNPGTTPVEVPSATKCAMCQKVGVDTQLRPCGHMFHERCLKPSLQTAMGQPKCPIDSIPMQSALLAVPTEENANPSSQSQQKWAAAAPASSSLRASQSSSA